MMENKAEGIKPYKELTVPESVQELQCYVDGEDCMTCAFRNSCIGFNELAVQVIDALEELTGHKELLKLLSGTVAN